MLDKDKPHDVLQRFRQLEELRRLPNQMPTHNPPDPLLRNSSNPTRSPETEFLLLRFIVRYHVVSGLVLVSFWRRSFIDRRNSGFVIYSLYTRPKAWTNRCISEYNCASFAIAYVSQHEQDLRFLRAIRQPLPEYVWIRVCCTLKWKKTFRIAANLTTARGESWGREHFTIARLFWVLRLTWSLLGHFPSRKSKWCWQINWFSGFSCNRIKHRRPNEDFFTMFTGTSPYARRNSISMAEHPNRLIEEGRDVRCSAIRMTLT